MKIYQLIVTVVTAFTLFSCAAEDNNGLDKPTVPTGEPATLKLTITDPVMSTRATGSNENDTILSNIMLFVFRANNDIDVDPQYIEQADFTTPFNITSAITNLAEKVYAVANIDTVAMDITNFRNVRTYKDFQKLRIDLKDKNDTYGSSQSNIMATMRGEGVITFDSQFEKATTTINLSFCVAKITLNSQTSRLRRPAGGGRNWDLILLHTPSNVSLCSDPFELPSDEFMYSGDITYKTAPVDPRIELVDFLAETVSTGSTNMLTTNFPHFYVFPNTDANLKTIFTLRETIADGTYRYWPTKFDKIEAGRSYVITYKIDDKYPTGAEDPEGEFKPISSGFSTVISTPVWATDSIGKDWTNPPAKP